MNELSWERRYRAKLWHYLFPLAMLAAGATVLTQTRAMPWQMFGYALFGLGMVLGVIVLPASMIVGAQAWLHEALGDYALQVRQMTPEQMDALGRHVPTMRVKRVGMFTLEMFEDTNCTMAFFREFMLKSNHHEIFEERSTSGERRRQWNDLVSWLLDGGYLIHESARGNHSYLWHEHKYAYLVAAYRKYIHGELPNLAHDDRAVRRAEERVL
jgi:hypothetical protein